MLKNEASTHNEHSGVTVSLAFEDASKAIAWYVAAFGAREDFRLAEPNGRIGHAELSLCGGSFSVSDEFPGFNHTPASLGGTSSVLHVFVPDVDVFVARAVKAGAKVVIAVKDQFYGYRSGRIEDPFGYLWIVSTKIEDVSPKEMQRRYDLLASGR